MEKTSIPTLCMYTSLDKHMQPTTETDNSYGREHYSKHHLKKKPPHQENHKAPDAVTLTVTTSNNSKDTSSMREATSKVSTAAQETMPVKTSLNDLQQKDAVTNKHAATTERKDITIKTPANTRSNAH